MVNGADGNRDVDLSVPAAEDSVVQERIFAECYADDQRRVYSVAMQIYFELPPSTHPNVGEGSNKP